MAKNEKSSSKAASIASDILAGRNPKPTPSQIKTIAASVLTQAPDKPKPKK